uniref:Reverse transcriptase zinc-binding domain-containing protein n=1 Tax=Aegilops tauschii subsp. strangulata TaxID=200361 RepID=A0A453NFD9_AEGTS
MKMYKHLMGDFEALKFFKLIWKIVCRLKHKIFFWLAMHNRINTRSLLKRKVFMMTDHSCPICNHQCEENTYASVLGLQFCSKLLEHSHSWKKTRYFWL